MQVAVIEDASDGFAEGSVLHGTNFEAGSRPVEVELVVV